MRDGCHLIEADFREVARTRSVCDWDGRASRGPSTPHTDIARGTTSLELSPHIDSRLSSEARLIGLGIIHAPTSIRG